MSTQNLDIAIIGDGILGSLCAYIISRDLRFDGRQVVVFYKENSHYSSKGNSAIGQSGILQLYWKDRDKDNRSNASMRLRNSIYNLKRITGGRYFHGNGIVDISMLEDTPSQFLSRVQLHGYSEEEVFEIQHKYAKMMLGPNVFNPNGIYFRTPDCCCDLDKLLNEIQLFCEIENVIFVPLKQGVILSPIDGEGHIISTEIGEFKTNHTILAAGHHNRTLLNDLGVKTNFRVGRMCQVAISDPSEFEYKAKISYSFSESGLPNKIYASHGWDSSEESDLLLLSSGHETIRNRDVEQNEQLTLRDIEHLKQSYPSCFHKAFTKENKDVNFCYLTSQDSKYNQAIENLEKLNLTYAVPGLASNAYHTAGEITKYIELIDKHELGTVTDLSRYHEINEKILWFRN